MCNASATTWDNWSAYIKAARKGATAPSPNPAIFSQLATELAATAKTFKPRGAAPPPAQTAAATKKAVTPVPSGLQKKLSAFGEAKLQEYAGGAVKFATQFHTTSEMEAALSITGAIVEKNGEKSAVLVLVATDKEREVSWSRLEGLILHWAATERLGSSWNAPPAGWSAVPSKSADAGSAVDSAFDKASLEGCLSQAYSLLLQLPLKGALRSGGITFVLKAAAGQNTRWLKEGSTEKDFFVDLQQLPKA